MMISNNNNKNNNKHTFKGNGVAHNRPFLLNRLGNTISDSSSLATVVFVTILGCLLVSSSEEEEEEEEEEE